ncbi:hypothetical protein [Streptomyces sp. NPDC019507]|uniref:hypothetical protein n=1 Tax=Streptomyces sp. NPDC019507 TaxID=3154689 RepID=UPI0033C64A30
MPKVSNDSESPVSDHPLGRLLAIPAKGASGRRSALTAYVGLLAASVGAGGYAITAQGHDARAARPASPGLERPDNAAYTTDAAPGYRPTWFDGAGGIAGVSFTDEQRKALIHEAERRGMSVQDAYALAYGDQAKITIHLDGTVDVDTTQVVVPNQPVYALTPPGMGGPIIRQAGGSLLAAGPLNPGPLVDIPQYGPPVPGQGVKGEKQGKGKEAKGKGGKGQGPKLIKPSNRNDIQPNLAPESDHYYENSGENPYQKPPGIRGALPPIVDDVIGLLPGYKQWLGEVAGNSSNVDTTITQQGNTVTITVTATISSDLAVTTSIAAPLSKQAGSFTVTTVVTNVNTGVELGRSDTQEVHDSSSATGVAIGQTVDAVIEAVKQDSNPTNDETPRPVLPPEFPTPPGWEAEQTPADAPTQGEEPPADPQAPAVEPEAPEAPTGALAASAA